MDNENDYSDLDAGQSEACSTCWFIGIVLLLLVLCAVMTARPPEWAGQGVHNAFMDAKQLALKGIAGKDVVLVNVGYPKVQSEIFIHHDDQDLYIMDTDSINMHIVCKDNCSSLPKSFRDSDGEHAIEDEGDFNKFITKYGVNPAPKAHNE